MSIVLAPGISHRPGSSSENIIQPVVDATGLILRPFSNGQSAPVFQVQNVDGTAVHFGLNPDGEIELSGGVGTSGQVLTSAGAGNPVAWSTPVTPNFATVPLLAPNLVDRNLIQPAGDNVAGMTIVPHSSGQSAPLFELRDATGNSLSQWYSNGLVQLGRYTATPGVMVNVVDHHVGSQIFYVSQSGNGGMCGITAGANTDPVLQLFGNSGAQAGNILEIYPDGESMRGSINGQGDLAIGTALVALSAATPRIGFLGAAAAVRQTGGAATAGVLYTAAEQGMLNAAYSALRTFGLLS